MKSRYVLCLIVLGLSAMFAVLPAWAEVAGLEAGNAIHVGQKFIWIAAILLAAKLSNFVTRIGQPPVLGELLVGVVLGNLALVGFYFLNRCSRTLFSDSWLSLVLSSSFFRSDLNPMSKE